MALGSCGHGAKVLIADGIFSFSTRSPLRALIVYLNFAPDLLRVTDVLNVLKDFILVESAIVMKPQDDSPQPIHEEFKMMLGTESPLTYLARMEFYNEVQSNDTCLVIATGEGGLLIY